MVVDIVVSIGTGTRQDFLVILPPDVYRYFTQTRRMFKRDVQGVVTNNLDKQIFVG